MCNKEVHLLVIRTSIVYFIGFFIHNIRSATSRFVLYTPRQTCEMLVFGI